jgi:hypothetical protein
MAKEVKSLNPASGCGRIMPNGGKKMYQCLIARPDPPRLDWGAVSMEESSI